MKNSVILALAALLLCGCTKDDDGCNENDYNYPPRDYSHLGDMSRYEGYYWFEGTKKTVIPIPNRYVILFKSKCSQRIMTEFEKNGIVIDDGSCGDYNLPVFPGNEIPDELKDCKFALVTADKDPASVVKGIIHSEHLYLIPPSLMELGQTNIVYVGLAPGADKKPLEKYAEELGIHLLGYDDFGDFILASLARTNRAAGSHVQVANWLYETGEFMLAYPEMGGYYIPDKK